MNEEPRFSIVVSTLGRLASLERLLRSLVGQLDEGDEMLLVVQRNYEDVQELCSQFEQLPIRLMRSELGLSKGRNVGAALCPDSGTYLLFPNDSSWYPSGSISSIRAAIATSSAAVGASRVFDSIGLRSEFPQPGTKLDRDNVWTIREAGMFIQSEMFQILGGFDEALGSGAPTPWQSGEGTDLLLRWLELAPDNAQGFLWMPKSCDIATATEAGGLTGSQRRQKIRAYGRGLGWQLRKHRYPVSRCLRTLVGGLAIGLRRSEYHVVDGLWAALGRAEGLLGRTFFSTGYLAVKQ